MQRGHYQPLSHQRPQRIQVVYNPSTPAQYLGNHHGTHLVSGAGGVAPHLHGDLLLGHLLSGTSIPPAPASIGLVGTRPQHPPQAVRQDGKDAALHRGLALVAADGRLRRLDGVAGTGRAEGPVDAGQTGLGGIAFRLSPGRPAHLRQTAARGEGVAHLCAAGLGAGIGAVAFRHRLPLHLQGGAVVLGLVGPVGPGHVALHGLKGLRRKRNGRERC